MRQDEAIRREHEALDELARIGQELDALDVLIYRFGQARRDWHNPEMVKRLNRARERLERERADWLARRAEAARYI